MNSVPIGSPISSQFVTEECDQLPNRTLNFEKLPFQHDAQMESLKTKANLRQVFSSSQARHLAAQVILVSLLEERRDRAYPRIRTRQEQLPQP